MHVALLDIVRCPQPACEGRLAVVPDGGKARSGNPWLGLIACKRCTASYPLLAGVPILLPDPLGWIARYRDSILATLAEYGEASRAAVSFVLELAAGAGPIAQELFVDDWTAGEASGPWPLPPGAATFGGHAFRSFLGEAEKRRPEEVLAAWCTRGRSPRARAGWVLDLGCGVGTTSAALAPRARHLVAADRSLRAVLSARERATSARQGTCTVHGLVIDGCDLPIRRAGLDVIAAAHLIDLVDAPVELLARCREALKKRGALLLSTPDPSLVDGPSPVLDSWLASANMTVERRDTVPWLRAHDGRHFQVYFSEVLMCRPGPATKT